MPNTSAESSWRAWLTAQGIPDDEVSGAISAAGKLAQAADGIECDLIDTPSPDGFDLKRAVESDPAEQQKDR